MPHQCTKCGELFPDASKALLEGCTCGSRFFYYIRQEKLEQLKNEYKSTIEELDRADKDQVEKDIRELTGMTNEPDKPVILDIESVRILQPGKFEIDLVNLFAKNRPLIYKLEEGKYIIDLASSMKFKGDDTSKKIFTSGDKKFGTESEKYEEEDDTDYEDKELIDKIVEKNMGEEDSENFI